MAKIHGKNGKIYVDGYDLSGDGNSMTVDVGVDVADVTCMGNTFKQFIEGIADASIDVESFYDGGAGKADAVLQDLIGSGSPTTPPIISAYPMGDSVDLNIGFAMEADLTKKPVTSAIGQGVSISFSFKGGILSRVKVIEKLADQDTTGTGSIVDMGAAAASDGIGFMHITGWSGSGTVDAVIWDDSDSNMATEATYITFAQASGNGAQRIAAGSVGNRYVRVKLTISTDGDFDIVVGLSYD